MKKQNRINSRTSKKSKFWCACDRQLVGEVGKCPVCKRRNNRKKLK